MASFITKCSPKNEKIYSVVSEIFYHSDLGEYQTYGIKVDTVNHALTLHDVSVCKEAVNEMVELFNREQLSPAHLQDAVMDMLP